MKTSSSQFYSENPIKEKVYLIEKGLFILNMINKKKPSCKDIKDFKTCIESNNHDA